MVVPLAAALIGTVVVAPPVLAREQARAEAASPAIAGDTPLTSCIRGRWPS